MYLHALRCLSMRWRCGRAWVTHGGAKGGGGVKVLLVHKQEGAGEVKGPLQQQLLHARAPLSS